MNLFKEHFVEKFDVTDGELFLHHQVDLGIPYSEVFESLQKEIVWRDEPIFLYGKPVKQPRLFAWYGDTGIKYSYSGLDLETVPWSELLLKIKTCVEEYAEQSFNSVLLNLYRDQNDHMGLHSDDEKELGKNPVIASLSLGETRIFQLKHKISKESFNLDLEEGSLLIMSGETQRYWKHGIKKERSQCGPRINLTFRNIIQ